MTVQTFDNFWVIENVLTDSQIDTLIDWHSNQEYELATDGSKDIHIFNVWDTSLNKIQTIDSIERKTEIIGLPRNLYSFLDTALTNIFTAVHGSALTLEYPTYFNKYVTGDFHEMHWDNGRPNPSWPIRLYNCSIQLSDTSDYTGGDLQIHKYIDDTCSSQDYMTAPRDKGCAIVYNPMAVHQVTKITSGTRYALIESAG